MTNSTESLIAQCLTNNSFAQQRLYHKYAPKMFGICMRFAKNEVEAEDILQEGFIKVFNNLKSFRNEGKLEAWIRRIMVNTAINFYKRKTPSFPEVDFDRLEPIHTSQESILDQLSHEELLSLVQKLPKGYRLVFNLYVIEGYSHKEIGEMLNVSINTSKSQLSRAKDLLRYRLKRKEKISDYKSNYLQEKIVC